MNNKLKGAFYACVSAVSYSFNPLCAKYLYMGGTAADGTHYAGLSTESTLFYRFLFGSGLLALLMLVQKRRFRVAASDLRHLALLGVIFALSSIFFFESFHTLSMGVACTLVFSYPVIVAVIMTLFFKEKMTATTLTSIIITCLGIAMLYQSDGPAAVSPVGLGFVMGSALAYSLYIVVLNRSSLVMSSVKITFYACLFCLSVITIYTLGKGAAIEPLTHGAQWFWATMLGLLPTVVSLVTMSMAVKAIGSTPTAIMGALEPVTAVILGALLFGEALTPRLVLGIVLILAAVLLIIMGGKLPSPKKMPFVARWGKRMEKRWKWRVN